MDSEEFRQAATEATRSAKARWKDIESGKVETKVEKTKIDLGSSVSFPRFQLIYKGYGREVEVESLSSLSLTYIKA